MATTRLVYLRRKCALPYVQRTEYDYQLFEDEERWSIPIISKSWFYSAAKQIYSIIKSHGVCGLLTMNSSASTLPWTAIPSTAMQESFTKIPMHRAISLVCRNIRSLQGACSSPSLTRDRLHMFGNALRKYQVRMKKRRSSKLSSDSSTRQYSKSTAARRTRFKKLVIFPGRYYRLTTRSRRTAHKTMTQRECW